MHRQSGFTLMELIIVVVLLGVVGLGVTSFIRFGTQIFIEVSARDEALSSSRFIIERLNRELREALPNSVRETASTDRQCLEFIPVLASTVYDDLPMRRSPGNSLNAIERGAYQFVSGHSAVVYPSIRAGELDVYDDTKGKRYAIDAVQSASASGELATFEFATNVEFAQHSPARRLYLVSSPVSYCVLQTGQVYRYANYGFNATQLTLGLGSGVLMATGVDNDVTASADQPFYVTQASLRRNAYINVFLRFNAAEETVSFNNEVHIANAP